MSADNGIISGRSKHTVEETVEDLKTMLAAKSIRVFAVIDHSGEAERAGFEMRPCKLLIFGNPKAGTPLMLAAPSAALDLPLKILVWEKHDGTAWLSYNNATWFQERHQVPANLMDNISSLAPLVATVAL